MLRVVFLFRFNFFFKVFLSRQLCLRYLYHLIDNSIIKICNQHVYKLKFNAFVIYLKKSVDAFTASSKKKIYLFLLLKWFVYFLQCKFISMRYNKKVNRLLIFAQKISSIEIFVENLQFTFKLRILLANMRT